jgi:single-strand DNA-binding protein
MSGLRIVGVGRLTKDPVKSTRVENKVEFRIAVNRGFGEKKKTDFLQVAAWGKVGENVQKFTKKGSLVQVDGILETNQNGETTYYEINASDVTFLDPKNENTQNHNQSFQNQPNHSAPHPFPTDDPFSGNLMDDDLPF